MASAGDGFVSVPVSVLSAFGVLDFTVTASAPDVDAVIGLAAGAPTWFPDIAAGVRLAPSGTIDVRDGDDYRADLTRAYGTASLGFHVVADLTSHTYSVIQGGATAADELARQYAFRTEQQAVSVLDHVGVIVDGDAGSVTVCAISATPSTGVVYSREGGYSVVPVGGGAVISDGATVELVDGAGTALAQATPGGVIAADAAGHVEVARILGTTLIVDHYSAGLVPAGQSSLEVGAGATVQAVSRLASGEVIAALSQGGSTVIVRTSDGASHTLHGGLVALDGDEAVVAWSTTTAILVARYAATGAALWGRSFPGRADVTALAIDPSHRVVFGGELLAPSNLGFGTLPLASNPDHAINGFVAELTAAGAPAFAARTGGSWVGGVASNGTRIVVSGTLWTQYPHDVLQAYDVTGAAVSLPAFDLGFSADQFGRGGAVALDAANHVWWNVTHQWPLTPQWPFLFAL